MKCNYLRSSGIQKSNAQSCTVSGERLLKTASIVALFFAISLFSIPVSAQDYGKFRLVEVSNSTTKEHVPVVGAVKSGETFSINGKEITFDKDNRNAGSLFKVKINGNYTKVYKTGSFGADVRLDMGENIVSVELFSADGELLAKGEKIISRTDPQKENSKKADNKKNEPQNRESDNSTDRNSVVRDAAGNEVVHVNHIVKTLDGAYLTYSPAGDRLGGSKINFLPAGIPLHVVESHGKLYKVSLSGSRYAYIERGSTELTANEPDSLYRGGYGLKPTIVDGITASADVVVREARSVNGKTLPDKLADVVNISMGERRPYIVYEETEPRRIVVELFGVECNANWMTQDYKLRTIKDIQFRQSGGDVMKVYINLNNSESWGYSVDYVGNTLVVKVNERPKDKLSLKGLLIGVDAGHGAENPGAISISGYEEKALNLDMAHTLKRLLEREGAAVVLTREGDEGPTMPERKAFLKSNGVDMLISIHCNAGGNPLSTGGTSTYYKHWVNRTLAKAVLERLVTLNGVRAFGLVGNFNFSLNAPTEYPAILVETLFMSNLDDEELITDPQFREKMMAEVVKGLKDYLKELNNR